MKTKKKYKGEKKKNKKLLIYKLIYTYEYIYLPRVHVRTHHTDTDVICNM